MHEVPLPLLEFSAVVLIAMLAGLIGARLKWPPVILLIIAGALIGPNTTGIIKTSGSIDFFAEIGAVLLLFAIGVEFNLARLIDSGVRAAIIGFLEMGAIFVFMYEVAIIFGFEPINALVVASVFLFSSTAIMMKMLKQMGLNLRREVPVLFSVLIVQDLMAIFVITFFSALRNFAQPQT